MMAAPDLIGIVGTVAGVLGVAADPPPAFGIVGLGSSSDEPQG